jgi:hypothetical protein
MKVSYKQRDVVDVIDDYIREAKISGRRVDYIELQEEEMKEFLLLAKGYTKVEVPFGHTYYTYNSIRVYGD